MRGESSDQREGSATITTRDVTARRGAWALAGLLLLTGLAACATWTGSVGAVLAKDNTDGRLYVRDAPAGMGAAKAGLATGDEVVAIDEKPVVKMTPPEVHEALSGRVGTTVKVKVVRRGVTLDFTVERGPLAGS
jgi:S1-C subfamily serine protease